MGSVMRASKERDNGITPGCVDRVGCVVMCCDTMRCTICKAWARGWELKGQERKKNDICTACQVNHDLMGRFCCHWCSNLFNYKRYFCIGVFFDFIEWLKV